MWICPLVTVGRFDIIFSNNCSLGIASESYKYDSKTTTDNKILIHIKKKSKGKKINNEILIVDKNHRYPDFL